MGIYKSCANIRSPSFILHGHSMCVLSISSVLAMHRITTFASQTLFCVVFKLLKKHEKGLQVQLYNIIDWESLHVIILLDGHPWPVNMVGYF